VRSPKNYRGKLHAEIENMHLLNPVSGDNGYRTLSPQPESLEVARGVVFFASSPEDGRYIDEAVWYGTKSSSSASPNMGN
jgi:hypothetical protein